jgi:hypothetical protein
MTERETRIDDMNDCKTRFISGVNPFLPEDRDITVPVTRCNGLCHVTRTLSRHRQQEADMHRERENPPEGKGINGTPREERGSRQKEEELQSHKV